MFINNSFLNFSQQVSRKPLFWHCVAFATGIVFSSLLELSFMAALIFLGFSALSLLLVKRSKNFYWLLILAFAAGSFWLAAWDFHQKEWPYTKGTPLVISGMALGNSTAGDKEGHYSFLLKTFSINGEPCREKLYVYADDNQEIVYGEYLEIAGKAMVVQSYDNANAFDYHQYLKRHNIYGSVSAAYGGSVAKTGESGGNFLLKMASWANLRFTEALAYLPQNQQTLLRGVFLGDKAGLDYSDKSILSKTGIMHAFSVSGLHVGYVVLLGMFFFGYSRRTRWQRLIAISIAVIFYAAITNFNPPVIRASVMAIVGLLAFSLDEKPDPYVALGLAALVCLLWQPLLVFDAGFQLSFIAVLGILYLTPVFKRLLPGNNYCVNLFAVSLAASSATMPLIAYYFYLVSIAAITISPLLVLGIGVVVMLSFVGCICALFSITLATLPLFAGGALIEVIYDLSTWVGSWRISSLAVSKPSIPLIITCYAILIAVPLILKKGHKWLVWVAIVTAMILLVLPLGSYQNRSDYYGLLAGKGEIMEVTFVDVGQGDCSLVITPQGKVLLIDGGGKSNNPGWVGENVLLPYLKSRGIKEIDLMIASHPDEDHVDGLITVLQFLPTDSLLTSQAFPENLLQQKLEQTARVAGTDIVYTKAGKKYCLEENVYLTVYLPTGDQTYDNEDTNAGSLVVKLSFQGMDFLFTGDVEGASLDSLVKQNVQAEVLKLPHHGSSGSFSPAFYAKVHPLAVVVSVGKGNSFGHPGKDILQYFTERKIALYRTDDDGSISFFTDGISLSVDTHIEEAI